MSAHTVARAFDNLQMGDVAAKTNKIAAWLVLVGSLLTALISVFHHQRFWSAYLIGFSFLLSITLGALFFVIIQHVVRAGWSVAVRRVAEGLAYNMRFLWVLFLPLIFAIHLGYLQPEAAGHHDDHGAVAEGHADPGHGEGEHHGNEWKTGPHLDNVAHGEMAASKKAWLSFPWLLGRFAIYFLVWIGLAHFFYSNSVKQDQTGDEAITHKMQWWAPVAVLLFAVTTALAGFDLLMALDPHWYSTIFGVYFFAGSFLSFNATLILSLYLLRRNGILTESVSAEHFHDVGKFMFAFVVFWAYIGYSQYMLIWYGNIPEETGWYLIRQSGDWAWVSAFLVLGHFVVPFLLLISRFPKRRPFLLALGAVYILFVHWVDLFWIVAPQKSPLGVLPPPLLDLFLTFALVGIYISFTVRNLKGVNLIPVGDPRLGESLNHENF